MPRPPKMNFSDFYNGLSFDDTYKIIESLGKVPEAYMRGKKVTYGEADFQALPKKLQAQLRGEAKEIMKSYKPMKSESLRIFKTKGGK